MRGIAGNNKEIADRTDYVVDNAERRFFGGIRKDRTSDNGDVNDISWEKGNKFKMNPEEK